MRKKLWLLSACLALLVASCKSDKRVVVPPWNQFHGDVANSGQILVGTKPPKETDVVSAPIGRVTNSAPVLAPDGSVYIATYLDPPGPDGPALVRLSTSSGVTVRKRIPLKGQLSTPAVDAAGNVYVAQFLDPDAGSHLLSFGPNDQLKWDIPITRGRALAPPKLLAVSGGTLVFQFYRGGSAAGGHVLIANDHGKTFPDVSVCGVVEGGFGRGKFVVPGIDSPPYPEDPAVGIRAVKSDRGSQYYLVAATNACGLSFFRLDLGATSADQPTLTTIKVLDSNAPNTYSAPAISADGTVVITDSNRRVTAYDIATGNDIWHYDATELVPATPTFLPLAINFVYVASYNQLIKLDLTTGQAVGQVGLIGPTSGSPAAGGQYIFVSTQSGLFTYGLNLNLLSFFPLAGGGSSPAIDSPSGRIYVAARNGWFYAFAGP